MCATGKEYEVGVEGLNGWGVEQEEGCEAEFLKNLSKKQDFWAAAHKKCYLYIRKKN